MDLNLHRCVVAGTADYYRTIFSSIRKYMILRSLTNVSSGSTEQLEVNSTTLLKLLRCELQAVYTRLGGTVFSNFVFCDLESCGFVTATTGSPNLYSGFRYFQSLHQY
jgi:hypothetical protein